jgi:hypothetical protein
MALSYKRSWTGRIRASIKRTNFDLVSLTNYNSKHPTRLFLSAAQLLTVQNAILTCQQLLAQQTLR